jgi:MFS family permease
MKHVWIITAVVAFFSLVTGDIVTAVPQACLARGFGSADLGLVVAAGNLGYAVGCLLWGRLFRRAAGKDVLRGGIAMTIAALLLMAQAQSVPAFVAAQFLSGLAGAATWPFASAWLLDFRSEGLTRTRLLRHYNLAWTCGLATGTFLTGILCKQGWIQESFLGGAVVAGGLLGLACLPRRTRPAGLQDGGGDPAGAPPSRIARPVLVAALLASLTAIATRALLMGNYAEFNESLGYAADRMGLLTSTGVLAQMLAFGLGSVYEPWLGRRRVYAVMAAALIGTLLTMAVTPALPALLAATALCGLVSAMAFQTSMLASTGHFASPRLGTTLHESLVGVGGLAPLAAGWLTAGMKGGGWAGLDALRAPYLVLAAVIATGLAAQLWLVAGRSPRTLLGAGGMPDGAPRQA